MPSFVSTIPARKSGATKYNWTEFFDGQARKFTQEDHPDATRIGFVSAARTALRKAGKDATLAIVTRDDGVYIGPRDTPIGDAVAPSDDSAASEVKAPKRTKARKKKSKKKSAEA